MKPIIKELEKSLKICASGANSVLKISVVRTRHKEVIRPLLTAAGVPNDWTANEVHPDMALQTYERWAKKLITELTKLPDLDADEDESPETEPTGEFH